jgi:hypothetical protein
VTDAVAQYRRNQTERDIRRDCAELVYHYPGYTLDDAMDMAIGDRRLLLTYARLHRSEKALEQANILAAIQSKRGYSKLINSLQGVIKELTSSL